MGEVWAFAPKLGAIGSDIASLGSEIGSHGSHFGAMAPESKLGKTIYSIIQVQYKLYLLIPHRLVKESFKNSKKKFFFSPQTPVPYDGGLTVVAHVLRTHHLPRSKRARICKPRLQFSTYRNVLSGSGDTQSLHFPIDTLISSFRKNARQHSKSIKLLHKS